MASAADQDRKAEIRFKLDTSGGRYKFGMDFQGYLDRIEFHFERLGVKARPSEQEYIDAWNNQIPAKKMAQTFARRQGRKRAAEGEGEQREQSPESSA